MPSGTPPGTTSKNDDRVASAEAFSKSDSKRHAFLGAAKRIVRQCQVIFGAEAGFFAWNTARAGRFELTFFDPGQLEHEDLSDLPELRSLRLPVPLRRLAGRAQTTGRPAFSNVLKSREADKALGLGRRSRVLRNALVAPILLRQGEVVGLVGLINKPGGFSRADRPVAMALAEMAAVAVDDSLPEGSLAESRRYLEKQVRDGAARLHQAEEAFRTLVENLPDIVARFDPKLRYLYANPVVQELVGQPLEGLLGKTNRQLGLPMELAEPWDLALRRVLSTGLPETLELPFPAPHGTRQFDWRIVPEHGTDGAIASALALARDVTDRWLAHTAESRTRFVAEALREATVALTSSLDRETVLATLLERLGRMVPFDRASVMLIEEAQRVSVRAIYDGSQIQRLLPEARPELVLAEHPVVEIILASGAPLVIPDLRTYSDWTLPTDPSVEVAWMGVPLFARGSVAGIFSLSKSEPGYFNEEHLRLAEAMSLQASVAVENAILYEQMRASTLRMQNLSRRLVDVQETERRDIARELHDEAGQALVSLRFGLRLMERELEEGESVGERVAELVERTDLVIESLHRLAADLRPVSLDHVGLDAALGQFVATAISSPTTIVRYKARGFTEQRLPAEVETALFRIAQEAMTNVARHAEASRVDLLVEHHGDRIQLVIEDDGVGFDGGRVWDGDQIGLIGMRERAESLGGTLMIETAAGKGTTIVVEVPCVDPHPDR